MREEHLDAPGYNPAHDDSQKRTRNEFSTTPKSRAEWDLFHEAWREDAFRCEMMSSLTDAEQKFLFGIDCPRVRDETLRRMFERRMS